MNGRSQAVEHKALAIQGWKLEQREDEKGADLMVLVAVDRLRGTKGGL